MARTAAVIAVAVLCWLAPATSDSVAASVAPYTLYYRTDDVLVNNNPSRKHNNNNNDASVLPIRTSGSVHPSNTNLPTLITRTNDNSEDVLLTNYNNRPIITRTNNNNGKLPTRTRGVDVSDSRSLHSNNRRLPTLITRTNDNTEDVIVTNYNNRPLLIKPDTNRSNSNKVVTRTSSVYRANAEGLYPNNRHLPTLTDQEPQEDVILTNYNSRYIPTRIGSVEISETGNVQPSNRRLPTRIEDVVVTDHNDKYFPARSNNEGARPSSVVNITDASRLRHRLHTSLGIANVSDAESLRRRLEMSTEFFLVPSSTTSTTTTTSTQATIITRASPCIGCTVPEELEDDIAAFTPPVFRNEVWVVPVLALSAICMLLIAGFEVFVLCKAWRTTPSRRHLFLGQMLLLGLFSCAGLGSILALSPTPASCAAVRFGTGVAYAVVFASLLVKCVFLISLNGGVYLPAPYQGLLLLFAVLIQIAIGGQWLITSPPLIDVLQVEEAPVLTRHRLLVTADDVTSTHTITLCRTPYIDILFSLCYVLFLIVFVSILAIKSRGIRDNYREATYIGLSVGCTIPIWLVWTLSGLVVNERHRDACLAFGMIATSAVIFLVMFMPKGRQLAAMGKDGVFMEDREDRFSSLSRAGSGYSPSFFHFKPVKYGGKHQPSPATITTLGADRVALCPAPPSYTRMLHCYPSPQCYYPARYLPGGVFIRPEDGNVYTTLEPTLSSNPNVYFQRGNGLHPGMMY